MKLNDINKLVAPLNGLLVDLAKVPDQVFAQGMVGHGFAIDPLSNELYSPIDGVVVLLHKNKHAITIESLSGEQILIHLGIDTVGLNAQGFTTHVSQGQSVQVGTLLISFDMDYLALNAKSLITPILVLNSSKSDIQAVFSDGDLINKGDSLFIFKATEKYNSQDESQQTLTSQPIALPNPAGMHARPSAKLASIAKEFNSKIFLQKNTSKANAKSITDILSLEIVYRDEITIQASGSDAKLALESLTLFILEHVETIEAHSSSKKQEANNIIQDSLGDFSGVCASEGIAIGTIFQLDNFEMIVPHYQAQPEQELPVIQKAIEVAIKELDELINQLNNNLDSPDSNIFNSHKEILKDPSLIDMTEQLIQEHNNAAYSWHKAFTNAAENLTKLGNENLAARANDIVDVGNRVLKNIIDKAESQNRFKDIPQKAILIAENLSPSDTAKLDRELISGFATTTGGSTSHVAILARSLGIPAIAGINPDVLNINNGTEVIINATQGLLTTNINDETKQRVIKEIQAQTRESEIEKETSHLPARTKDNVLIEVAANIASEGDASSAFDLGCDGVGLLRSEFLYFDRPAPPTFEEQFKTYQNITTILNKKTEKPLVIRTLDVGGDKPLPYLDIPAEDNPFLGQRGIRVSLTHLELFTEQIRAILSVKPLKNIHIMFPMISSLQELLEAKRIIKEEQQKLNIKKVSIGIMVEVPSVALMADIFAPHVDFFSIGANDLTQYTLAIDRGHPQLAKNADSLNPAVLKLIELTCSAAKKNDIWVGVCGGVAGDIKAVPILLGLGVTELSVSIPMIPKVKACVRELSIDNCREKAQQALQSKSSQDVRAL